MFTLCRPSPNRLITNSYQSDWIFCLSQCYQDFQQYFSTIEVTMRKMSRIFIVSSVSIWRSPLKALAQQKKMDNFFHIRWLIFLVNHFDFGRYQNSRTFRPWSKVKWRKLAVQYVRGPDEQAAFLKTCQKRAKCCDEYLNFPKLVIL